MYIVLAPALLAEGLFHYREGLRQGVASTTTKYYARNSEKSIFPIPKTCKLLQALWQSQILHRMQTSGRMHTPTDGRGRGNTSNGTFNTALNMIEPTPILPVLLKQ